MAVSERPRVEQGAGGQTMAMADQPLQTITVVYFHVQELNLKSKTTGTFTTTVSRTPGIHTLWPLIYRPDEQPTRRREVFALPVTVASGGTGYLTTHTKPLEPAIKSRPHVTAASPKPTSPSLALHDGDMVPFDSISDLAMSALPEEAVAKFGSYGTIAAVLLLVILLHSSLQRLKRWHRSRRRRIDEEARGK